MGAPPQSWSDAGARPQVPPRPSPDLPILPTTPVTLPAHLDIGFDELHPGRDLQPGDRIVLLLRRSHGAETLDRFVRMTCLEVVDPSFEAFRSYSSAGPPGIAGRIARVRLLVELFDERGRLLGDDRLRTHVPGRVRHRKLRATSGTLLVAASAPWLASHRLNPLVLATLGRPDAEALDVTWPWGDYEGSKGPPRRHGQLECWTAPLELRWDDRTIFTARSTHTWRMAPFLLTGGHLRLEARHVDGERAVLLEVVGARQGKRTSTEAR